MSSLGVDCEVDLLGGEGPVTGGVLDKRRRLHRNVRLQLRRQFISGYEHQRSSFALDRCRFSSWPAKSYSTSLVLAPALLSLLLTELLNLGN